MPIIPTYESSAVPARRAPFLVTPRTEVGAAITGLGRVVTDIAIKFKRAEEVTQYNESMRGLREDLTELRFSFVERTDFENFQEDFQKESATIEKKRFEEMRDNSLWSSFEAQMGSAMISTEVAVRTMKRKRQVDFGRASYIAGIGKMAEDYGRATEVEKENLVIQAQDMTDLNADVGYITRQEAQEAMREFRYNAMKSDTWHTAKALGYEIGIEWLQDEKNAPKLTEADRDSMVADLRREWGIEKVEKKDQERKLNALSYDNFLEQIVGWEKGECPLPTHTEIMKSPITDPKMKAQLMAYLDSVEKAENPFLNSDPRTFGDVVTGLYLNIEDWNRNRIIEYMGAGLSTQHTLFALKEYERLLKAPSPKKDSQLALGLRILNRAASEGMFIGKDLKTEATDQEIINNYSMHARAISELLRRAEEEEDPIEVTKELMKPHVDRKIENWLTRKWREIFDSKEYEEQYIREEAIQQLQEEGELVTEDSINQSIEEIRERNAD